ncbi:hypothetical protein [Halorarius halobius]|uniref:hypothetical protein n=1 Tax=Halorarius halobius TaxID=2962671 RepID=UPI0020CB8904|nr:hypothetical protein [Halorarius halobius]
MRTRRLAPVALAVAGLAAVVVGVHQGLVHVAPGYEGTIQSGWDGPLSHEERLLARLAVVGAVGAAGALRWRRLAVVPAAAGGVVLLYVLRAMATYLQDPGLYTETTTYGGDPVMFVFGAEPFLLLAGGGLLVTAGVVGWRATTRGAGGDAAAPSSA